VGNAGDNIITVSAFIACVQHLRQQVADTTRIFYLCAVAMGQPYVEQWRADLQVARYLNNTPVKIDNTLQTIDRVSSDLNCVRPSKCWGSSLYSSPIALLWAINGIELATMAELLTRRFPNSVLCVFKLWLLVIIRPAGAFSMKLTLASRSGTAGKRRFFCVLAFKFLNFHIFLLSKSCNFKLFFKLAWLNQQFYEGVCS